MDRGTIKADGTVIMHGCTPSDTRLVGISKRFIAIKHPGGRWWDNGGEHYTPAWIEVRELAELHRSNVRGEYYFRTMRVGGGLSFHPTMKVAQQNAIEKLDDLVPEAAEGD